LFGILLRVLQLLERKGVEEFLIVGSSLLIEKGLKMVRICFDLASDVGKMRDVQLSGGPGGCLSRTVRKSDGARWAPV
jgi:hypothetical protein